MEFKINGRNFRLDVVEVRDQYVMWGIQWNNQVIEKCLKRCIISKVTLQGIDYVAVHDPYYQKITYHRVEFMYVHRLKKHFVALTNGYTEYLPLKHDPNESLDD